MFTRAELTKEINENRRTDDTEERGWEIQDWGYSDLSEKKKKNPKNMKSMFEAVKQLGGGR